MSKWGDNLVRRNCRELSGFAKKQPRKPVPSSEAFRQYPGVAQRLLAKGEVAGMN